MKRDFFTAAEFAAMGLAGLPRTRQGVNLYLRRNDSTQLSIRREAKGGGLAYHYLSLPLEGIVDFEARFRPRLAHDETRSKGDGASIIETAEGGRLRAFVSRELFLNLDITGSQLRRICREEFGDVLMTGSDDQDAHEMPSVRTFQSYIERERARRDQRRSADLDADEYAHLSRVQVTALLDLYKTAFESLSDEVDIATIGPASRKESAAVASLKALLIAKDDIFANVINTSTHLTKGKPDRG